MEKIFYIKSSLVQKAYRKHNPYYIMVQVVEHLNFGKVKVDCYWFDIPCAYYPCSYIGSDIVDEKDIKELNFENILNDFKDGYHNRKYWYWNFLELFYNYNAHCTWRTDNELEIAYKNEVIATIDTNDIDDWCKGQHVLKEIDIVLDDMIKHGIECENCNRLKEIIRTDEVTITTEEYLRMKGYIK